MSEIELQVEQLKDVQKLTSDLPDPVIEEYGGPIELRPDRQPWERHPDETEREWIMFCIFRDLDPIERSLANAYKAYLASMGRASTKSSEAGRPIPRYYTIYNANRWQERVDAYDKFIDSKVQAELIDQRILSRVALAKLGAVLRRKAGEAAALIQSMVVRNGKVQSALSVKEIATLARLAKDLEMSALGISGGSGGGTFDLNLNIRTASENDDEIVDKASRILAERQQLIDAEVTNRGEAGSTGTTG